MADGVTDILQDKRALARKRAYEAPLETLNPAWASAFRDDAHWPYFERLRNEDPVHFTPDSNYGAYWSITKYHDIVAVDSNHKVFSSASGIGLPAKSTLCAAARAALAQQSAPSFIGMDPTGARYSAQDREPGGRSCSLGGDGAADPGARRDDSRFAADR